MKKNILAVILLAAIGGITYYLLQNKKAPGQIIFDKELANGKWQIDSMVAQKDSTKDGFVLMLFESDSSSRKQVYELKPGGQVLISNPTDSLSDVDSSSFSWGKGNEIIWKEKLTEPGADTFTVMKLNKNEFVLRTTDSTLIYLKKAK